MLLTDAAPLSAPAFSLVFPFLKMVLTEMPHRSEEEEERMAQILQILTVHAQLRASPSNLPGRVDEVGRGAQLSLWPEGGQEARAFDTPGRSAVLVRQGSVCVGPLGGEPLCSLPAAVRASEKHAGLLCLRVSDLKTYCVCLVSNSEDSTGPSPFGLLIIMKLNLIY